jgi:hypothetical protein
VRCLRSGPADVRGTELRVEPLQEGGDVHREHLAAVGGHGRAGDELLTQRVDQDPALANAVVEVRSGGQAGTADATDDLALAHPLTRADVDPGEMVVHGLVAAPVSQHDGEPVAAVPARLGDHRVGHRPHRRADRRPVVHREVWPIAAQHRVEARVRETGGDAREVERGAQEHLPHRAPARIVVLAAARGVAEGDAGEQRAPDARVLRDQHVAVAQEEVADVALLHQEAEAVAGQ